MNELNKKYKYQLRCLKDTKNIIIKRLELEPTNKGLIIQLSEINKQIKLLEA